MREFGFFRAEIGGVARSSEFEENKSRGLCSRTPLNRRAPHTHDFCVSSVTYSRVYPIVSASLACWSVTPQPGPCPSKASLFARPHPPHDGSVDISSLAVYCLGIHDRGAVGLFERLQLFSKQSRNVYVYLATCVRCQILTTSVATASCCSPATSRTLFTAQSRVKHERS